MTASNGPSILATMIRLGLTKFAISKNAPDVAEVVRTQPTWSSPASWLAWAP